MRRPPRLLVVCVEASPEAHAFRAAAEAWGWDVSVVWAGSKRDATRGLARSADHDVLILACHGDERGLLMPVLAPELVEALGGPVLTAAEVADAAPDGVAPTVLCTACLSGTGAFARAFGARGARVYLGAPGWPDGDAVTMYALRFLYGRTRGASDADAAASAADAAGEPVLIPVVPDDA